MEAHVAQHDDIAGNRNSPPEMGIHEKSTVAYVQDYEGLDWLANPNRAKVQQWDLVRGDGSVRETVGSDSLLAHMSLLWPVYMKQAECYSPIMVAGATTFFLVPCFETDVGVGAALLFGYAVGAATFFVANRNEVALRVEVETNKACNSEERQMMSVVRFDPEPLFTQNPNPQSLSQAGFLSAVAR